jgi:hypothetical protein
VSMPRLLEVGGFANGCCPLLAVAAKLQRGKLVCRQPWVPSEPCPWVVPSLNKKEEKSCIQWLPSLLFPPECADPNLAISAIWTFRDLGVRRAHVTILLPPCPQSHQLVQLLEEISCIPHSMGLTFVTPH